MELYHLDKNKIFLISTKAVIVDDGKVLVLRSPPGDTVWDGKWELPGGLMDMGETFEQALLREVKEESGLTIRVHEIFTVGKVFFPNFKLRDGRTLDSEFILLAFYCSHPKGEIILSEEHDQARWVTREELATLPPSPSSEFAIKAFLEKPMPSLA